MTDNVISFPRELSKESNPTNPTEYVQVVGKMRESLADDATDSIMQNNINLLYLHGMFGDLDELNVKDAIFLEETIRAIIYRYKNLEHPLHEVIDDLVTLPDEENQETTKKELTHEENSVTVD